MLSLVETNIKQEKKILEKMQTGNGKNIQFQVPKHVDDPRTD